MNLPGEYGQCTVGEGNTGTVKWVWRHESKAPNIQFYSTAKQGTFKALPEGPPAVTKE